MGLWVSQLEHIFGNVPNEVRLPDTEPWYGAPHFAPLRLNGCIQGEWSLPDQWADCDVTAHWAITLTPGWWTLSERFGGEFEINKFQYGAQRWLTFV